MRPGSEPQLLELRKCEGADIIKIAIRTVHFNVDANYGCSTNDTGNPVAAVRQTEVWRTTGRVTQQDPRRFTRSFQDRKIVRCMSGDHGNSVSQQHSSEEKLPPPHTPRETPQPTSFTRAQPVGETLQVIFLEALSVQ
jgi:hypothetical protein